MLDETAALIEELQNLRPPLPTTLNSFTETLRNKVVQALRSRQSDETTGMNQVRAFQDTVALAEDSEMPHLPGSDLGLDHLEAMLKTVHSESFSPSKLGRWLGWAQAALVAADVGVTLEDVKQINLRHADQPVPLVDSQVTGDGLHDLVVEAVERLNAASIPLGMSEAHFNARTIVDVREILTRPIPPVPLVAVEGEREKLAAIIRESRFTSQPRSYPNQTNERIADAILAAGFRLGVPDERSE